MTCTAIQNIVLGEKILKGFPDNENVVTTLKHFSPYYHTLPSSLCLHGL